MSDREVHNLFLLLYKENEIIMKKLADVTAALADLKVSVDKLIAADKAEDLQPAVDQINAMKVAVDAALPVPPPAPVANPAGPSA